MLCIVTKKCFHGGSMRNPGDKVTWEGDKKDLPKHFEPVKPEPKRQETA